LIRTRERRCGGALDGLRRSIEPEAVLGRVLFGLAAAALTADAIGYFLGAIRPILAGLAPSDAYWRRRLLLNLLLAGHGLLFVASAGWVAFFLLESQRSAAALLALLCAASSLYSVVTILVFTRSDAAHAIPRGLALAAYIAVFALGVAR
jgi:hypothetical protein